MRRFLVLLLFGVSVTGAGCGSTSATNSPSAVQVSLTAPTDGATVIVRHIQVVGTVTPENASVVVSGRRVRPVHGVFKAPLSLHKGVTHIRIRGSASGFLGTSMVVSVHYTPPAPQQDDIAGGAPTASGGGGGPTAGQGRSVPASAKTAAIASCSASSGGQTNLCVCVFDHLFQSGFGSVAQWQALVANWRRSFLQNGTISYPPVMRKAIVTCASQVGR